MQGLWPIELMREAQALLSTQQSYTKIRDVFDGGELLTPDSLAKVNDEVMIARQMTANVQRRINTLREKLPKDYRDENGRSWNADTEKVIRDTYQDFDEAVKLGKKISGWASLKIDGSRYPEK